MHNIIKYYREVRNTSRDAVMYAVMVGIFGAIGLDAWYQHAAKPIMYVAEYAHAEEVEVVQIEVAIDWTEDRIKKEIRDRAQEYNVSAEVMETVIWCESRFNKDALGDGGKSRGLAQIHSYYHPQVLDEQAYDPAFAIKFLAEKLANGQGYLWSCYNSNY